MSLYAPWIKHGERNICFFKKNEKQWEQKILEIIIDKLNFKCYVNYSCTKKIGFSKTIKVPK